MIKNSKVNEKKNIKTTIKEYLYIFKWIFGNGKKHFVGIALFTLLGFSSTLVGLLSGLNNKDIVDIITNRRTGDLIKAFIFMVVIQLVSVLISTISSYISKYISTHVGNEIKESVYQKIMNSKWEELNRFPSGQLISRWSGDSTVIANGILNSLPNAVIVVFRFVASLWMVLRYDATFAVFTLIGIPLSILVSKTNLKRMQKSSMEMLDVNAEISGFTQNSFSDIQSIKALDMVKFYVAKLKILQNKNADIQMKNQRISAINSIILIICSQAITYITYGWGIYRVWHGYITYGVLTMFLTLSSTLTGAAQSLINIIPSTISLANSARRVIELDNLSKEEYINEEKVERYSESGKNVGVGINIKDVSFSYKNGNAVFADADFTANPREIVGLVGPSGEGKTTLLRLMLAIIYAREGSANLYEGCVDDNATSLPVSAASRKLFAYVPQGNTMFSGTIADNMRNVKEDASDEEIEDALKKACAWDFVAKLPEGINTVLKEKGGGLSEGQSQRLSIARALLRNSPILLLDEATSALDMDTQKRVLDNIVNDEYPRTVILTTHRQEVMDICDRVYLIKQGTVTLK